MHKYILSNNFICIYLNINIISLWNLNIKKKWQGRLRKSQIIKRTKQTNKQKTKQTNKCSKSQQKIGCRNEQTNEQTWRLLTDCVWAVVSVLCFVSLFQFLSAAKTASSLFVANTPIRSYYPLRELKGLRGFWAPNWRVLEMSLTPPPPLPPHHTERRTGA